MLSGSECDQSNPGPVAGPAGEKDRYTVYSSQSSADHHTGGFINRCCVSHDMWIVDMIDTTLAVCGPKPFFGFHN